MEKHELIIPARFDCKDAVAGLKAIEDSGHVASDLKHAADAASAQFRKAHESIKAASQEFLSLRRALPQSPDHEIRPTAGGFAGNEAGGDVATTLSPEAWLESREDVRSNASARFGDLGMQATDEQTGEYQSGLTTWGIPSQQGAELSGSLTERGNRETLGKAHLPAAGAPAGPSDGQSASDILFRAVEQAKSRGLGGEFGLKDGISRSEQARTFADSLQQREARGEDIEAFLEKNEILGDVRQRRELAQGLGYPAVEPSGVGRLERMPGKAVADYVKWATGDREGSRDGQAATRLVGAAVADGKSGAQHRGLQQEAVARHESGGATEGFDPQEGIRRIRTASPIAVPADDPLAEEPTIRPMRGRIGFSPAEWEPGAQLRGAATGNAIERLLREQNELIRQDIQRNANPPIAAPPPMRGGGIRMG